MGVHPLDNASRTDEAMLSTMAQPKRFRSCGCTNKVVFVRGPRSASHGIHTLHRRPLPAVVCEPKDTQPLLNTLHTDLSFHLLVHEQSPATVDEERAIQREDIA